MGVVHYLSDTLKSLVNRMGSDGSKGQGMHYFVPAYSEADLLNAYRGTWVAKKIVNIPPFDATREWRAWLASAEQIEKLEAEERRLQLRQKVLTAMIRARLFGGSALYIGTKDADVSQPLRPETVGLEGVTYLTPLTMRQLSRGDVVLDPVDELFNKPGFYTLRQQNGAELKIHPSRLMIFVGEALPDDDLTGTHGWGDSVLLSILGSIKNADSTAANIASLVFEAKVDVFKIKGLMKNLANPEYERRLLTRISLAAQAKGIDGALIMDDEEGYEQKQVSFAQLPEVLHTFMQLVSGAADIPITRFLGQSPAGMNATGESDIRNYYDRISAMQNMHVTPLMETFDECLIRSALGARPPEVFYEWRSLWQLSEKEQSEIGNNLATMVEKLNATGLLPQEGLAKSAINAFTENGILPGLEEEVDEAGGLPDYEAELEAEQARAIEAAQAKNVVQMKRAVGDEDETDGD